MASGHPGATFQFYDTQIVASKLDAGKTVLTRPLCVYPQVETYKGSGDINDAANFVCAVRVKHGAL